MGGIIMRQFNLEEYVKNPTRPIITRDGRAARIICTDRKGVGVDSPYPIVALIECHDEIDKTEAVMTFTPVYYSHLKISWIGASSRLLSRDSTRKTLSHSTKYW